MSSLQVGGVNVSSPITRRTAACKKAGNDTASPVDDIERFSITYGGMWKEFFQEIQQLRNDKLVLEHELSSKKEELELIQFSNHELREQYKENLIDLMETRSDHVELKDIFEQLQAEKEDLKNRLLGLEDHLDWIKRQNQDLQENILYWKEKYQVVLNDNIQKETEIKRLRDNTQLLVADCENKQNTIQQVNQDVERYGKDKLTLKKSLEQKVKIINDLLKERDALKSAIEQMNCKDIIDHHKKVGTPSPTNNTPRRSTRNSSKSVPAKLFTSPVNNTKSPCRTPRDIRSLYLHISPQTKAEEMNPDSYNPWTSLRDTNPVEIVVGKSTTCKTK